MIELLRSIHRRAGGATTFRALGATTGWVAALMLGLLVALGTAFTAAPAAAQGASQRGTRVGDYIVAVVNSELVTANEVEQRLARAREQIQRNGGREPAADVLRKRVLDALIDERVQVTHARDSGTKVDEVELDRAVNSVAAANRITLAELRRRLASEGIDFVRFRNNLRDQILVERVREREVQGRIRITDADVDKYLEQQRSAAAASTELNLAQIMVTVPEGATEAVIAERRARIDAALAKVRAGADFAAVAREVSEDGNRAKGGEIGLRPASRLPDLFTDAVRNLKVGEVTPVPVRSGAGFHLIKVLDRRDGAAIRITQTHARHILLRASAQVSAEDASRRLEGLKRQIDSGQRRFEDVAREVSEDASAAAGGDLGWQSPGGFVPEFEEAMNRLGPGAVSPPVVSRFGVHLIQVIERREVELSEKEVREQARAALREQKFEAAYLDWVKDLRARAYIEMREAPQ
ncbi:MAG: peptidylprolyl isomerase [Ideonella sp.]|nr:peptidylprolyl isomerase [Ideonella sp.]MCC7455864.1 peptidylprolyl isomerase [Nitrospira sp.]